MKLLLENWRRYILSEGLELTDREKAEAEKLLKMTGFQLQQHVQMVLQMGAQPVYEKILGAMQAGIYGDKGATIATEIMKIAPQLTPVEGDFAKDTGEAVVFEEGSYITQQEWNDISKYVEAYRDEKNKVQTAKVIQRDADMQRNYTGWLSNLGGLFRRLYDYGSYLDESRGVVLRRGGWKRALDAGYLKRPEDDQKIPVGEDDYMQIQGTRKDGYELVQTISDYVDMRPPWER
jgi:hypothetical protein